VNPSTVYVGLNFLGWLVFTLIFTVNQVYYVTVVGMTPFQLVLVGTILEASVFLFEVPTGVVADVKSRRLSVVIGYIIMGCGFVLEGTVPLFWSVAVAQVLWGLGYTFTSGASEAWIADEVGESAAGEIYLRGSQWANIGALVAIPFSVLLGNIRITLPIVSGGIALIGLGVLLALVMEEDGFTPLPPGERTTWSRMGDTISLGRKMVQRQPVLLNLLGIGFILGFYSEGLDRLWTPHLLGNFIFPFQDTLTVVTWFGIIRGVRLLLSFMAIHQVRRRLDLQRARLIARLSRWINGLIIVALLGFGLTHSFWLALALFWVIGTLRNIDDPLYTALVNHKVDDSKVRATLLSVSSQANAIGQITGGPAVGWVGNLSIRAALFVSALFLSPVIPLYTRVLRKDNGEVVNPPLD